MNVLILGSGGREHALGVRVSQSPLCEEVYFLPGNAGTATAGTNINLPIDDFNLIAEVCRELRIGLAIIGPEQPLSAGIADALRLQGVTVFGPTAAAALIESDKAYAKGLMARAGVPTAAYRVFGSEERVHAASYLHTCALPVVVKASGLAAGKGVYICTTVEEAETALAEIFGERIFGSSGDTIVIEEFMEGEEASLFVITDGSRYTCLPAAQDHKRIGDGDTGKNTGGMGAYAPAPVYTVQVHQQVITAIIEPVLRQMQAEGTPFTGCLYCGLMLTASGPKVVEFNCRFGDPETQAVLQVTGGDFLGLLFSAALGVLNPELVSYNGGAAVCVIAASAGYPGSYSAGKQITGLDEAESGARVFHSGTALTQGGIVTAGGRVLGVTAFSATGSIRNAAESAYRAFGSITFDGIYFRKDIAARATRG